MDQDKRAEHAERLNRAEHWLDDWMVDQGVTLRRGIIAYPKDMHIIETYLPQEAQDAISPEHTR